MLWVGGPAVVHTGAAPAMVALVRAGYVDVLFAGNALATHDIEAALFGTSLGVDLAKGSGVAARPRAPHPGASTRSARPGRSPAAVENGVLTGGVMHAMVQAGKPFVLVGRCATTVRCPTSTPTSSRASGRCGPSCPASASAIMVATMLHSIATGNILPASVPLVCVDINPATVTKLADRGSAQAVGIVTDIGLFLEQLARELCLSGVAGS